MEYRSLGRTGIQVGRFGLGTMVLGAWGNTDLAECDRIIKRALDGGINLVDTADTYGAGENEEIVGRAIKGRRDDVVLCTKFHNPLGDDPDPNHRGNSRRWIMTAVENSLRRLGTDRIDLYQVHRPDPDTAIDETVQALNDLLASGKIRAWGTSTFPPAEIVEAHWAGGRCGGVGPHTEQPPYSILNRGIEPEVLPVCRRYEMGVITWSPLAAGYLTGKYERDAPPPEGSRADVNAEHFDAGNQTKFDAVERLKPIAAEAGVPLRYLALAFVVEHPAVTAALIGPRTEDQLDDLLGAADVHLDSDTLDAIDEVVAPGVTINLRDNYWTPPALDPRHRRRTT